MNICIVIPCYKSTLSTSEKLSVFQCLKQLGHYRLIVVCPEGLRLPRELIDFEKITFPSAFFRSAESYSKLLLHEAFYLKFPNIDYMLIHQLDAYVFRDELAQWCDKGYAFIGAPWGKSAFLKKFRKSGMLPKISESPLLARLVYGHDFLVGNGGFSLRHLPACKSIFRKYKPQLEASVIPEDVIWSLLAPCWDKHYKVPSVARAMYFSVEKNAEKYIHLMQGRLPFGCHAWEKYTPEFWENHIPRSKSV